MKNKFSKNWDRSKQPRKQRKFRANAPLHIRNRFLGSNLSKELRKKYGKRSIPVRKGDKIKILRGESKGKSGKIERINIKTCKVYVEGMDVVKKDGTKRLVAFHPSNLSILELNLDDKKRTKSLNKKEEKKEELNKEEGEKKNG